VIKLIQITDTHLTHPPGSSFKGRDPAFFLERALIDVADQHPDAHALLLTGDLVHDDPRAYDPIASLVERWFFGPHSSAKPVLVLPGNHDVKEGVTALQKQLWDVSEPVLTFHDWSVIGIDSTEPPHAHGRIHDAEIERVRARLSHADSPHVLAALHHPPLPIGSAWMDEIGLKNSPALWAALTDPRLRGVVHGHIHQPFYGVHHGVPVWGTPSSVWQFKVGDDYGLDEQRLGAYRWMVLDAQGGIHTELAWV